MLGHGNPLASKMQSCFPWNVDYYIESPNLIEIWNLVQHLACCSSHCKNTACHSHAHLMIICCHMTLLCSDLKMEKLYSMTEMSGLRGHLPRECERNSEKNACGLGSRLEVDLLPDMAITKASDLTNWEVISASSCADLLLIWEVIRLKAVLITSQFVKSEASIFAFICGEEFTVN